MWGAGFIVAVALMGAQSASSPLADDMWSRTQKHDAEQRAANVETDYWLVSTVLEGLKQKRFYVDRNHLMDSQMPGTAHGWVDMYEVIGEKRPIHLAHSKSLMEATCSGDPKIRFKTTVKYKTGGGVDLESAAGSWNEIIPGSSMETLHRFFCHDEPANALGTMYGTTPEKDALAYFVRQAR